MYGLGDIDIKTTLCPGGKARLEALMQLVASGRLDLAQLITHSVPLDDIADAYLVFAEQREGVIKMAVRP